MDAFVGLLLSQVWKTVAEESDIPYSAAETIT